MTHNDDLARWGEPPADDDELALADRLADALAPGARPDDSFHGAPPELTAAGLELVETAGRIERMIETVADRAGVFAGLAEGATELRLRVLREVGGQFVTIASTHPAAASRDLGRVPDDADRLRVRTGDRVRLEVACSRAGYLTVLNVGPAGALSLLHPRRGRAAEATAAGEVVCVAEVEMTPPAGREQVWAVWSRAPLARGDVSRLVRPGGRLRDMARVQETVSLLPAEDWHAVMLELDHIGGLQIAD